ncbi:hypothetical protein GCM10010207_60510 [Streptomyces atratus]|nr:hypothetical protein GCM10010207_60510 [Streptomyces atratus]
MRGSFRTFLDTARIKEFSQQKNSAGNHKNEPNEMRKQIWPAVNPVQVQAMKWVTSCGREIPDVYGCIFKEVRVPGEGSAGVVAPQGSPGECP